MVEGYIKNMFPDEDPKPGDSKPEKIDLWLTDWRCFGVSSNLI